jgi:hypothetical protein
MSAFWEEVIAWPMPMVAAQSAQPTSAHTKRMLSFLAFIVFSGLNDWNGSSQIFTMG